MLFGGRTVQSLLYEDTVAHVSTKSSFTHLCWCRPGALIHTRHHLDSRADFSAGSSCLNLPLLPVRGQEVKVGDDGISYTWKLVLFLGATFGSGAVTPTPPCVGRLRGRERGSRWGAPVSELSPPPSVFKHRVQLVVPRTCRDP